MANMTISTTQPVYQGGKTKMRSVTFTHTDETTAGGSATTTFKITGKLIAVYTASGDAEWQFVLNNGVLDIHTSGNMSATSTIRSLGLSFDGSQPDAATDVMKPIPMVGQTLKCTTTNVSTASPSITVVYEESSSI